MRYNTRKDNMAYCDWDKASHENIVYHDTEWGTPLHDDRGQFEFLSLEVLQCGLNWNMMMKKREIFRACFDNFNYDKVADYGPADIARIMGTAGMIRSERKISAIINNAKCFREMRRDNGSFSDYIWSYSGGKIILYDRHAAGYVPASNALSERVSRDLKSRGFKFLGPVVIYSHLQATGVINDHDAHCPRRREILSCYPSIRKRRDNEKGVRYYGRAR